MSRTGVANTKRLRVTTHSSGGFLKCGRNEFVRPLLWSKNLRVCCLLEPAIKTLSLSLVWAGDGCELHCDRCHRCHLVATYDGASSLASCCDIGQIRDLIFVFSCSVRPSQKMRLFFCASFQGQRCGPRKADSVPENEHRVSFATCSRDIF